MDMKQLLKDHPKTAIVVKQWLLNKLLESMKDQTVPEEFKEAVRQQGIDDDKVAGILNNSPRALFDMFDNHKFYIETLHETTGFWWKIKNSEDFLRLASIPVPTRIESDTEAVIEAFKLLEDMI